MAPSRQSVLDTCASEHLVYLWLACVKPRTECLFTSKHQQKVNLSNNSTYNHEVESNHRKSLSPICFCVRRYIVDKEASSKEKSHFKEIYYDITSII